MEKGEIYQALEDDFTSTFIRELLPGVLHNFANPLNGIMGRSKLLQRRVDDAVKKINDQYPEAALALQDEIQRIKNDIRSVNKESESFFEMFRDASGKFYALAARGDDRINLSQLLAAEMRFADFYLEFKHEITKNVQLDSDIPDFIGNTAELSLVFWRLIRFAMTRALESTDKCFFLTTEHDEEKIVVSLKYSGEAMPEDQKNIIMKYLRGDATDMADSTMDKGVLLALMILKKYSVGVQFFIKGGYNVMSVTISYRNLKK
jgi:signal transduction histidine kinase